MKRHMENARAGLGRLGALAAKTEDAERKILDAAQKRRADVVAGIKQLQPGIEGASDEDQDRYTELVSERGQLDVVIAKAQKTLGL